jgi:hypothetical protein
MDTNRCPVGRARCARMNNFIGELLSLKMISV